MSLEADSWGRLTQVFVRSKLPLAPRLAIPLSFSAEDKRPDGFWGGPQQDLPGRQQGQLPWRQDWEIYFPWNFTKRWWAEPRKVPMLTQFYQEQNFIASGTEVLFAYIT